MPKIARRQMLASAAGGLVMLGAAGRPRRLLASDKPMTIIVPYAAGGTAGDAFARILANSMGEELKRNIIVENKPGANGIIAATHVAKATPDGTTLLLGGTGPVSLNVMLRPNLGYSLDSFQSVAMLFEGALTITAATRLKVGNVAELVEYSKANGPLRYGTFGPGSVSELYGLLLEKALGLRLISVPYKSNSAALIDLIGGNGDVSVATPISLVDYEKRGDLKILALTTDKRDPSFPEIPSVSELGYPELKSSYWTALHTTKGAPMEQVRSVSESAVRTVKTAAFQELLVKNGQVDKSGGPEVLDAQLQYDRQYWGRIIKDNNIVLSS